MRSPSRPCAKVSFCYLRRMSQPVKLSDRLVLDARLVGEEAERSIAGQIEFWATLGRAVEGVLRTPEALALRRAGGGRPLSACLSEPGTPAGDKRVAAVLAGLPFPHYETAPGQKGLLVRIEEDGTRTIGRFVNRKFEVASPASAKPRSRIHAA
jgi:hypothetical protein